jgi:hypothetical protein
MMSLDVPAEDAERIEEVIASAESPVGIDAKKTHVIIIQKLVEIERRLERIEEQMSGRS